MDVCKNRNLWDPAEFLGYESMLFADNFCISLQMQPLHFRIFFWNASQFWYFNDCRFEIRY